MPSTHGNVRLSKTGWILERRKAKALRHEIRSLRINLNTTINVLTFSSTTRLQVQLSDIRSTKQDHHDQVRHILPNLPVGLPSIQARVAQALDVNEPQLPCIPFPAHDRQKDPSTLPTLEGKVGVESLPTFTAPNPPVIQVSCKLRRRHLICTPTCTCCCHSRSTWKSPTWLRYLIGNMFAGYAGLPVLNRSCDSVECRYRSDPTVMIHYYFPPWFAHQVLKFCLQFSKRNGVVQSLRVSRIVWNGSEIMRSIQRGDLAGVKAVLDARR